MLNSDVFHFIELHLHTYKTLCCGKITVMHGLLLSFIVIIPSSPSSVILQLIPCSCSRRIWGMNTSGMTSACCLKAARVTSNPDPGLSIRWDVWLLNLKVQHWKSFSLTPDTHVFSVWKRNTGHLYEVAAVESSISSRHEERSSEPQQSGVHRACDLSYGEEDLLSFSALHSLSPCAHVVSLSFSSGELSGW